MSQIGDNIRAARQRNGDTQEAVARRADIATGTLMRIELGRNQPNLETLGKIAAALGLTLAELVHDEPVAS